MYHAALYFYFSFELRKGILFGYSIFFSDDKIPNFCESGLIASKHEVFLRIVFLL